MKVIRFFMQEVFFDPSSIVSSITLASAVILLIWRVLVLYHNDREKEREANKEIILALVRGNKDGDN